MDKTYYLIVEYENDSNNAQDQEQGKTYRVKIDFVTELSQTLIEYLTTLESDELVEDDYGNLRYIGADPNNYVLFNNELWRIIGVMKDVENADGTKEDKVKLIRSESIGSYSWDNNNSNDWSDSALQKVLNEGAYYNRTSGACPSGRNGATKTCDFSESGLTESAKNMISESVWNLGGSSTYNDVTTKTFYERERGINVYSGHATTWTGKVGLMYPSDYGYATSGGNMTNRDTCLNTVLYNWDVDGVSDCKNNDWLYKSNIVQWKIMPSSSNSSDVFIVNSVGKVGYIAAYLTFASFPSVYLESNVVIKSGGAGSSISPFILK